jgi:hypothetical protein
VSIGKLFSVSIICRYDFTLGEVVIAFFAELFFSASSSNRKSEVLIGLLIEPNPKRVEPDCSGFWPSRELLGSEFLFKLRCKRAFNPSFIARHSVVNYLMLER